MKKIMFNDRYGLTEAVLEGRKTMTRRIIPELKGKSDCELTEWGINEKGRAVISIVIDLPFSTEYLDIYPHYQPGKVVAVAQSYMDAGYDPHMLQLIDIKEPTILPFSDGLPVLGYVEAPIMYHAGWKNKMFVHPTMMPHQIRITNVSVERLQDISDNDCLREGILEDCPGVQYSYPTEIGYCGQYPFGTPREAFAALIDKVSGKGTWQTNPWVFVYEFELVK